MSFWRTTHEGKGLSNNTEVSAYATQHLQINTYLGDFQSKYKIPIRDNLGISIQKAA